MKVNSDDNNTRPTATTNNEAPPRPTAEAREIDMRLVKDCTLPERHWLRDGSNFSFWASNMRIVLSSLWKDVRDKTDPYKSDWKWLAAMVLRVNIHPESEAQQLVEDLTRPKQIFEMLEGAYRAPRLGWSRRPSHDSSLSVNSYPSQSPTLVQEATSVRGEIIDSEGSNSGYEEAAAVNQTHLPPVCHVKEEEDSDDENQSMAAHPSTSALFSHSDSIYKDENVDPAERATSKPHKEDYISFPNPQKMALPGISIELVYEKLNAIN